MAWTETTRARYERHSGRYESDLTDQEWGLIAPFLPPPKTTGRPRSTAMRDVLDAILYIASAVEVRQRKPGTKLDSKNFFRSRWSNRGGLSKASCSLGERMRIRGIGVLR